MIICITKIFNKLVSLFIFFLNMEFNVLNNYKPVLNKTLEYKIIKEWQPFSIYAKRYLIITLMNQVSLLIEVLIVLI